MHGYKHTIYIHSTHTQLHTNVYICTKIYTYAYKHRCISTKSLSFSYVMVNTLLCVRTRVHVCVSLIVSVTRYPYAPESQHDLRSPDLRPRRNHHRHLRDLRALSSSAKRHFKPALVAHERGAPVLKHHPPVLRLCLSLHWTPRLCRFAAFVIQTNVLSL